MNAQRRYCWTIISDCYSRTELHFLTIWVTALTVLPAFQLSVLQTILSDKDGMGLSATSAATIVNGQNALSAFFGIVGAMVLDGYLTHYGLIFCSSLFYSAGLLLLHFATGGGNNMILFLVGLFLVAVGKSSLTYSAIALSGKQLPISFVNFFFEFTILTMALVFGMPSDFLVASILICLVVVGSLFYYKLKAKSFRKAIGERREPLIRVLCVYIAALKKCNLPSPESPYTLFVGNPEHPLEPTSGKRFLEKAAITDRSVPEGEQKRWLCTITEVEECKRLLHMVPICMAFLSYGLIYSIGDTYFLEQSDQMDTTIGGEDGLEIPIQAFLILASLSKIAIKRLYKVFIWKKLRGSAETYAPAIEYAMGMVLSTLCCAVASWVAMETRTSSSKMSVFLLTPQFIVFGGMDGLAGDSIQEFFTTELPDSMKNYYTVFSKGIVGAGTVCAILLVLATSQWLEAKTIRWDRFYLLCTVIGISIFFYYSFAAVRYYCQDNQEIQVKDESEQEEGEIQVEDESEQEEGGADSAELVIDMTHASQGETEEAPKAKLLPAVRFKTSARAAVFIGKAQQITKKNRGFNPDKEN